MDIYKLKFTRLQGSIFRLLCVRAGQRLNKRQISGLLGVSPTAVAKALEGVEKEGLVKAVQDDSGRWSVELNREDQKVMQLKRADNLRMIYESGLADFLEREFAGAAVVLFGSYSRGEDTVRSDIDVAVIGRKEKDVDLSVFEKLLGRRIVINFYSSFGKIHKNLRENIFNGIVLAGSIEL